MTDFAELRVVNGNNLTGRWKVGSAVNFNRGDFVKVYVPFRGQTFNQYFPVTEVLAKVIEVDKTNNYIYTDYYSPFDYKNYTWRTGTDVMVKVEPKKNVSISNIRIQDISPNKTDRHLDKRLQMVKTDTFSLVVLELHMGLISTSQMYNLKI